MQRMDMWTQGGRRGWDELGDWDRHIHATMCEQIASGKRMHSSGSSAQCSVMTSSGGMGGG